MREYLHNTQDGLAAAIPFFVSKEGRRILQRFFFLLLAIRHITSGNYYSNKKGKKYENLIIQPYVKMVWLI